MLNNTTSAASGSGFYSANSSGPQMPTAGSVSAHDGLERPVGSSGVGQGLLADLARQRAEQAQQQMQQKNIAAAAGAAANNASFGSPSTASISANSATAIAPHNTLIVFDWDDTLFPTSALERNRVLRMPSL